jgi:hypothetical protein
MVAAADGRLKLRGRSTKLRSPAPGRAAEEDSGLECPHALSNPDHKEVKRALLQKQIELADLTETEYLAHLNA